MKRILFCFLLTVYCLFSFSQPKLVVGIVVDQMRYDYIYKYSAKFGSDGFRRLLGEGFFCKNTNYNYVPTFTGPGHAAIYTGTTPSVNGIVSNEWRDSEKGSQVYCVEDKLVISVGGSTSAGKMSPRNLISSTVGEELRKASLGKSKVIGIALKDRGAILPAGHNASAAYWYDGSSGNWITSTYYMKELPPWVISFNKEKLASGYLSQTWNTLLPADTYTESDGDDNICEQVFAGKPQPVFPYDLPVLMNQNGGLGMIRSTPFGNSLTKDFAIRAIKNENLGRGTASDMLCISFSSTDYIGHQFGPQSMEVEDCYIRLDQDIAELLKFLEGWLGKQNVLVFLTADHGASESVPCLQKKNIPSGVIYERIISDSLKRFFSRIYNDTALLVNITDFDIYLNRKKSKEKKIDMNALQKSTVAYLKKLNGIAEAVSSDEIKTENFQDSVKSKVKAGFYPKRCGDIIFVLKPNWLEGYSKGTSHGSPYYYDTHVPLLWWGWKIPSGESKEALSITQIAPTVSKIMQIPLPNGCRDKPILFPAK